MSVHSNDYPTEEEYERDLRSEYVWDRFNEYHEEGSDEIGKLSEYGRNERK